MPTTSFSTWLHGLSADPQGFGQDTGIAQGKHQDQTLRPGQVTRLGTDPLRQKDLRMVMCAISLLVHVVRYRFCIYTSV